MTVQTRHLARRRAAPLLIIATLVALLVPVATASAAPPYSAYFGKDASFHQAQADTLGAQGYRMISLSVYGSASNPGYAAVWVKRSGPSWVAFHGLSSSDYQVFYDTQVSSGFRPKIITATGNTGGTAVFAGVFEASSTPQVARHNMSATSFRDRMKWARDNGFYPRWVTSYGTAAAPLFAGVWEENTAKVPWNYSYLDSASVHQAKFEAFYGTWTRPHLVTLSNSQLYTSIWYDRPIGPMASIHDATGDQLQTAFDDLTAAGYYPLRFQGGGSGAATRYAAIFVKSETVLPKTWHLTGAAKPALDPFEQWMKDLMVANQVRAGELAIVRKGKLVYARGFTHAEAGYPITQPTSLFRIASTSKPLTSIAIHQLRQGRAPALTYNSKMQTILGLETPSGNPPVDSQWDDINVEQLLTHQGGWNATAYGFDPVFNDVTTNTAFGGTLPVSKSEVASYMAGRYLSFTPGLDVKYSNFGFVLLGKIIEKKRPGFTYTNAVKDRVFDPLGVSRPRVGASSYSAHAPTEVRYQPRVPAICQSVVSNARPWVPCQYGGWNQPNLDAAGGWVLSAPDYAKVLAAFDPTITNPLLTSASETAMWSPPTGFPNNSGLLKGWFRDVAKCGAGTGWMQHHNGSLPGTAALVARACNGTSFVVMLNRDVEGLLGGPTHGKQLAALAAGIPNADWPTADLFPSVGIPSF